MNNWEREHASNRKIVISFNTLILLLQSYHAAPKDNEQCTIDNGQLR